MATAYKYQERDLDSQVNYADIGLGISNLVTDQLATRKAKKEAYDDQKREYEKYAKQFPTGEDVGVNSWTSAYSTDMTQKTLEQYRAFKNGQVSEREHVEFMANMKNSTESVFNVSQVFQDAYALKIERMNSADPNKRSQGLEPWLMEQNENYLNYADTKPIIDKYGQVQLTRKDNSGNVEYLTPEQLNNRSKAQYNYFNSDAELTRMEVGLGEEMIQTLKAATVGKVGSIQDIQDKAVKAGFDKAVDDYINSLDAPINISSVLTNDIGGAYMNNFTYSIDEANADPNKILLKVPKGREGNPEPDFASTENGKKQEIAAKEWLKRQLIEKIDRKIGVDQTSAVGYRSSSSSDGGGKKVNTTAVTLWDQLRWGTVEEKNQAAQSLVQMKFDDGLIGINFDKRGNIELEYDPESGFTDNTVTLYDPETGKDKTPLEWAEIGVEVHGVKDMNKVAEVAGTSFKRPYRSIGKYKNGKLMNPQDFAKAGHRRNIDK
jgi:hypothetical protein